MNKRKAHMLFNTVFADLVGANALVGITGDDIPEAFRSTVVEGWIRDERGAWLLRDFLETYHGSPEAFTDVTGYEAAVNGRGIPDLDLAVDGKARAAVLARRGVAFAHGALSRLNADHPDHPVATAYVSISVIDMDDEIEYDGSVTFVSVHEGERPYLRDVGAVTANAVLAVDSTECA